ncbi:hypothetical protein [Thalassotalea atypica]|nr:hypothetical protein [Thalassotalea atypica]
MADIIQIFLIRRSYDVQENPRLLPTWKNADEKAMLSGTMLLSHIVD